MLPVDVSIVIVNWNSVAYLKKCLVSVYANTTELQFEIIVVDNASYDGCDTMLQAEFPDVKFIQSTVNLGFAKANNLGASRATGRFLLFLNPDTSVVGDAVAELMCVFTSHPDAAVVGCRLLNADLSIQMSCVQAFPTILSEVLDNGYLREKFPNSSLWGTEALSSVGTGTAQVECVSGACLMIRQGVFAAVGGFSTVFFMYVEDRDLCFKTSQLGYKTYYVGGTTVIHYSGSSSQSRAENNFATVMRLESLLEFMRQRRGSLYAWMYRFSAGVSAVVKVAFLGTLVILRQRRVGNSDVLCAFRKWVRVLRWAVGLESWVARHASQVS
jgi:GT2 family glycosyltransferase